MNRNRIKIPVEGGHTFFSISYLSTSGVCKKILDPLGVAMIIWLVMKQLLKFNI